MRGRPMEGRRGVEEEGKRKAGRCEKLGKWDMGSRTANDKWRVRKYAELSSPPRLIRSVVERLRPSSIILTVEKRHHAQI